jgi:hypothetical protein
MTRHGSQVAGEDEEFENLFVQSQHIQYPLPPGLLTQFVKLIKVRILLPLIVIKYLNSE